MKLYNDHIGANAFAIDAEGNVLEGVDAFKDIDLKTQYSNLKKGLDVKLPVYECTMDDGRKVNILAMYGAGLWGAIWGYVAVEDDNETLAGAIFDHASETPGLGAKIAEPAFYTQFRGKKLLDNGAFSSVMVVKGGANGADNGVDAITGVTVTSKATINAVNAGLDFINTRLKEG
jgi:Na+-transporting NADH:ubiquinone oxidoreductase subunit C